MAGSLVTVELKAASGLAKDSVVNNFFFDTGPVLTEAEANAAFDAVEGFYNDDRSGVASSVGNLLSATISRAAAIHRLRLYKIEDSMMGGAPHGSPAYERAWTLDADGSVAASLPQEVAIVLTLEGTGRSVAPVEAAGDTRPRARRSGRIYLGPFDADQLSSSTDPRPSSALITRILDAGEALYDESVAAGIPWCVWSRADAAHYQLEAVSVANDWDIQRRRGAAPTARTRRSVL